MEAVIVAGGFGTRLRPLTERHPKHLLHVGGVPFVVHQLSKLAQVGVGKVVLATSYRADAFEPVLGTGEAYGVELAYVTEDEPLGTGGAVRNAANVLDPGPDAPIIVLNGDVLSGHDLATQVARHRDCAADITLHLVEVDDARPFGCVPTDPSGRVAAFVEKSPDPVSQQVNAGCYVFTRSVIDSIPAGRPVSIERETFPDLLAAGVDIRGYVESAYWIDVGTPAALVQASRDLVCGIAASPAYPSAPGERRVLAGAQVAADARVCGGSVIGSDAVVESGALVDGSVLADGAYVGSSAQLRSSVVGVGARIGSGAVLADAVVGDDAVVADGCRLTDERVDCGAEVG